MRTYAYLYVITTFYFNWMNTTSLAKYDWKL